MGSKQQFFIIDSYGRTATQWVAHVLAAHPDIAVTHGPDLILTPDPNETEIERMIRHIGGDNPFHSLNALGVMENLSKQTDKQFVGNVHGLKAVDYAFGAHHLGTSPIRYASITRHPVHRINSFASHYRKSSNLVPDRDRMIEDAVTSVVAKTPLLMRLTSSANYKQDELATLRLAALHTVSSNDRQVLRHRLPRYGFERLTQDRDYLLDMLRHVTSPTINISDEYEADIDALSAVDQTGSSQALAPASYEAWPEWQKAAFSYFFPKDLYHQLYSPLGYCYPV